MTVQQIAGLAMRIGGGLILWAVITVLFFGRAARAHESEPAVRRGGRP